MSEESDLLTLVFCRASGIDPKSLMGSILRYEGGQMDAWEVEDHAVFERDWEAVGAFIRDPTDFFNRNFNL